MRYFVLISILQLSSSVGLYSQNSQRIVPSYPGEYMEYTFKWGVFSVGKAEISFEENQKDCGSLIKASAHSEGIAKVFKNIRYDFSSCMDPTDGLPRAASRIVDEGGFHHKSKVYYFHNLRPDSSVVFSSELGSVAVKKNSYDMLTAFCAFRANNITPQMPVNSLFSYTTFFIDAPWDLKIRYAGRETIKTIFGLVECYKFYPVTEVGPFFDSTDDMIIWITADNRKIPVRFHVELRAGSITADLQKYIPPTK